MTLISNLTQLTGHYVPRINQLTQEPLEPWLDVAFARKWLTTGWEESLPSILTVWYQMVVTVLTDRILFLAWSLYWLTESCSWHGHCIDWQNPVLGMVTVLTDRILFLAWSLYWLTESCSWHGHCIDWQNPVLGMVTVLTDRILFLAWSLYWLTESCSWHGHCIDWQNPVVGISRKMTTVLSSWWPNSWTLRGAEPTPLTSLPLTTCLVAALPSGSTAKLWYVVRPSWLFFCNLPCSPLLQCTGVYFEHNVSDKFFTLEIRFVVVVHLTK